MSELFSSKTIIKPTSLVTKTTLSSSSNLFKNLIDPILLCTIDEDAPTSSSKIYLSELSSLCPEEWNKTQVDRALFERLRMQDPSNELIISTAKITSIPNYIVTESRCLHYLAGCYQRLSEQKDYFQSILDDIQQLFIDHSANAILLPSMYENQDLSKQWMDLLLESQKSSLLLEYIDCVNNKLVQSITDEVETLYKNVFNHIYKVIQPLDYFSNELIPYITILTYISKWPRFVQIMFQISHPKTLLNRSSKYSDISLASGRAFQDTLIGSLLSKSCLPSFPGKSYIFFNKPKSMSERDIEYTATTLWEPMKAYQDTLTQLFKMFVKNVDARNDVLQWIGDCFEENHEKIKEWSSNDSLAAAVLFVSDGFLMNLNVILLNLAKPFAEPYSNKLLKINPLYAICQNQNVHLKDLRMEASLIDRREETEDEKHPQTTFNFITDIFFMTHFSYSCSVCQIYRQLLKITEEISNKKKEYKRTINLMGSDSENVKALQDSIENDRTAYLNLKTVLNEPHLLDLSNSLLRSTCSWLVHLASLPSDSKLNEDEQINVLKTLPLKSQPNRQLSYIPEFIIQNIIIFFKFLGQFNMEYFQSMGSLINEYIYLILVFMGDVNRLHNPHLRATLAAALDVFVPEQNNNNDEILNCSFSATVFQYCPLIEHLPRVLLDVFVSIELTEQAVAFQQKFNYRCPMYNILQYLWRFDEHRSQLKKLASYAERHIDDAEPPIFLRFVNVLMNDANYLLDEGLRYMTKLKTHEDFKNSSQWHHISEMQRQELANTFQTDGQYARYVNIIGMKTLIILSIITEEIQSIFCHSTICDQLTLMLNFFLKYLVEPNSRNLKVRNLSEYFFEPSKMVAKITDIYLHFSRYDQFCISISKDGMSYSHNLFSQCINVLHRIKYPPERIVEFEHFAERIQKTAAKHRESEIEYDDAPDEYTDPITKVLMNDPVMLPASRKILDRTTIARHHLSDQTDPFNREPLRMQDLIPQNELKQLIEQWKASKHQ